MAVPAYVSSLHAFTKHLEERRNNTDVPDDTRVFLEEVDKRLAVLEHELQEQDIPYEEDSGHVIVKATINGRLSGRFLLDTGATLVTMSDAFALRAKLDLPETTSLKMTVADGRHVDARAVLLHSMSVGDATVSNVVVAVVPTEPAPGLDGLLGMSFLREFLINLDPVGQKLVLSDLFHKGHDTSRRPAFLPRRVVVDRLLASPIQAATRFPARRRPPRFSIPARSWKPSRI